jgi:NTE family protein
MPPLSVVSLDGAIDALRADGAQVEVVHPDESTESAFASAGGNVLDATVREPAMRAGRAQGRRVAEERVATLLR